ncbi:hypothetical protein [Mucilaginibacter auburnensis]|uniref:Uncharacterized protein n=1 Tax=Mucilaginibacter auburnensis TaxID=1457233 RepID=A0A2H9VNB7_9SPHI|nr:hypothetical protein [Mucilaginibacter auburnensis]PJJ79819.1 hypothetical protein CLV57_2958 [Mucilaginibacter auburnensis]
MKPLILPFLIFTALLAAPPLLLMQAGRADLLIANFWLWFAVLTGLTFIAVASIVIGGRISAENYAQIFLAATVVKLLLCLSFVVVHLLKHQENKLVFASNFFYLYFLNTAFEVYVLLRNLRHQKLK